MDVIQFTLQKSVFKQLVVKINADNEHSSFWKGSPSYLVTSSLVTNSVCVDVWITVVDKTYNREWKQVVGSYEISTETRDLDVHNLWFDANEIRLRLARKLGAE